MIDLLLLRIPFKSEYILQTKSHEEIGGRHGQYIDLVEISRLSGCKLNSRNVEFCIDGDLTVSDLNHPFESLPSSFASLAMKIHSGNTFLTPCVELKASPAKLLQCHNVFGSTDLELCSLEMLAGLGASMPYLYDLLDITNTRLDWMDATYSARVASEYVAQQVIDGLRNVTNGQTKPSKFNREYQTTIEWNTGSKLKSLKIYLKGQEFQHQLKILNNELTQHPNDKLLQYKHSILNSPELIEWANKCVRFEARLKHNYLEKNGIPRKLFDAINYQKEYEQDGKDLIKDLWNISFKSLLDAIKGGDMKIHNDLSIKTKLQHEYGRLTPKGNISYAKADRLFGFYRRLINEGYKAVNNSMARNTFWRYEQELMLIGLSKAQLQNLHGQQTNVIPLIRIIDIDFSRQRPAWYQEPKSFYEQNFNFKVA